MINERNWPERSLCYLCRTFDSMNRGENYRNARTAIQIGIVNFTLFEQNPEFFSNRNLLFVRFFLHNPIHRPPHSFCEGDLGLESGIFSQVCGVKGFRRQRYGTPTVLAKTQGHLAEFSPSPYALMISGQKNRIPQLPASAFPIQWAASFAVLYIFPRFFTGSPESISTLASNSCILPAKTSDFYSFSYLFHTIYISLDTFRSFLHNKDIESDLEAWLCFFSSDVVKLVNAHPEFFALYQDIAEFRRHPKELITMFSKALSILDHNTELLTLQMMLDESRQETQQTRQQAEQQIHSLQEQVRELKKQLKQAGIKSDPF